MIKKPISWNGHHLDELAIYEMSDWKGIGIPDAKNFEVIYLYQCVESLYRIINKFPTCPVRDFLNEQSWMEIVVIAISSLIDKKNDRMFHEKIVKSYLYKYGMDQILEIHGVDVNELKNQLDNMIKNS